MLKHKIIIFYFCSYIYLVSSRYFKCPDSSEPPQALDNPNYSFQPVIFDIDPLTPVILSEKVLVNTHFSYFQSIKDYYIDSYYCPKDFVIIKKDELVTIINDLGDKAYSTFTDKNGLNMSENIYYNINTKGNGEYNKIFMILKNNKIEFEDFDPYEYMISSKPPKFHTICRLNIPQIEIVFPENKRDFDYNTNIKLNISFNGFLVDYIWKINDNLIKDESVTLTLRESGVNNVEFWGKYATGLNIYLCEMFYVGKEKLQMSDDDQYDITIIKTDYKINYNPSLHFTTSNCPVAPRDDGGYYVAFPDTDKYLHILSFDKDDHLIKDLDTREKARPHDITSTYLGFAVYCVDADNRDYSYLTLYDKNFQHIKRVIVMNNNVTGDDYLTESSPDKQLMRYNSQGNPNYGIRFIYQADNAKLVYSRGRILLIFAHYNIFRIDDKRGHNADTVVTFNDMLEDIDFGLIFGSSHSLIQSATFDENYFWTATLSDAYPQGIKVEYISKRNFKNDYDPVNKKNNIRDFGQNNDLAGKIKGYEIGWADGKLGGILYFEDLELYALIYAKTPNYSEDEKNEKTIIYITTWKFVNEKIEEIKIKEIKIFETGNVMQVRAGKFGKDKVFITYLETNSLGHNYYGDVPKGSVPKFFLVKLPDFEFIENDKKDDILLMNTNEDLRTFRNGDLIWAACDKDNNLVINKIVANDESKEEDTKQETENQVSDEPFSESPIVLAITWKDIYKLNMNGVKKINNTEIHGPTLNLRGITSNSIKTGHTFIINLIFQINTGLRHLEGEDKIIIQAICEVSEKGEKQEDLQMVDYECVGKDSSDKDLSNYKLVDIEEGNNDDSLKVSNLNSLVSEIKEKYEGNLNNLENVQQSSFTPAEFNKIVIFQMNEKISNITAQDFKFQFKIDGKLNKYITSEATSINKEFDLVEIDTKANCIFTIGENKIASISCDLNVENHKDIKEFSFKTSEIKTQNNEIYLSKFSDILLINSEKEEDDDDNNNRNWVIIVSVVCSVVVAVGIGIGIYFIIKNIKSKGVNNTNEVNDNNIRKTNEPITEGGNTNRVIEFKN